MGSDAPLARPDASGMEVQAGQVLEIGGGNHPDSSPVSPSARGDTPWQQQQQQQGGRAWRRRRPSRAQRRSLLTGYGDKERQQKAEGGGEDGDNDHNGEDDFSSVSTDDEIPPIHAYGHTYHGSGTILTPNDESERARLEIQHELFKLCLDGALTAASLPSRPLTILDLGTGTGAWAIEMAESRSDAQVRGIDISAALLPTAVPPNVVFEIGDVNDPWAGEGESLDLDFIHVRNLVGGGVRDWEALYSQAFRHLRPGGQIEVSEVRTRWFDFDDSGDEEEVGRRSLCASREYEVGVVSCSAQLGVDFDPIPKVRGWLEDIGFERVQEMSDMVPVRASGQDAKMRRKGAQLAQLIDYGLENYSLSLFGKCGWAEDDIRDLMTRIRREMVDYSQQTFGKVAFVTARKPLESA